MRGVKVHLGRIVLASCGRDLLSGLVVEIHVQRFKYLTKAVQGILRQCLVENQLQIWKTSEGIGDCLINQCATGELLARSRRQVAQTGFNLVAIL